MFGGSKLKVWNEMQIFDLYVIFTIVSILTDLHPASLVKEMHHYDKKTPFFFAFMDNNWRSTLENLESNVQHLTFGEMKHQTSQAKQIIC